MHVLLANAGLNRNEKRIVLCNSQDSSGLIRFSLKALYGNVLRKPDSRVCAASSSSALFLFEANLVYNVAC